jgi:formylglycine-generating enzyme required for sulfatase activity
MTRRHSLVAFLVFSLVFFVAAPAGSQTKLAPRLQTRDGAEMVLIPGGRFGFGVSRAAVERLVRSLHEPMISFYETELPETTKELPDFYIDKYEVTNGLFSRFVNATSRAQNRFSGYKSLSRDKQPVVGIGWQEAERYCAWAEKRLPTEVEWEKAARGTDRRTWPWGNEPDEKRFNGRATGNRSAVDVGSFSAGDSPYGVSDMAGNVWEMTTSRWPNEGSRSRVMKGGSYLNTLADVRVSVRWSAQNEEAGATWLGFRCVMDASGAVRIDKK